jgi:molecular chaperone GrpE
MTQTEPEGQKNDIELGVAKIEIKELRQSLSEEKEKAEKNLTNWQRAQADFVNYKRRADQEKEEIGKFANSGLILKLLPFLDDMERAMASAPPELTEDNWVNGIKLIGRKLLTSLESQGVSVIKAVGESFDPRVHEAVRQVPGKEGIIIEEMQKGYKLGDKVLRPSQVVVGNGEEPSEEDQEE